MEWVLKMCHLDAKWSAPVDGLSSWPRMPPSPSSPSSPQIGQSGLNVTSASSLKVGQVSKAIKKMMDKKKNVARPPPVAGCDAQQDSPRLFG